MNTELKLSNGFTTRVVESRKSAVPSGIGVHYIVGVRKDDGSEVDFDEVDETSDWQILLFGKKFAQAQSAEFGHPGLYRLIQNGDGLGSRKNYHLHILILKISLEELESRGYSLRRIVDSDSFVVPIR